MSVLLVKCATVQAMSEKMVAKSMKICQTLLSEEPREKLQGLVLQEKGPEFVQAKKDVLRHALPEIVNHVSDSNVDVAANISELVVEHTLNCLEKINHKMVSGECLCPFNTNILHAVQTAERDTGQEPADT